MTTHNEPLSKRESAQPKYEPSQSNIKVNSGYYIQPSPLDYPDDFVDELLAFHPQASNEVLLSTQCRADNSAGIYQEQVNLFGNNNYSSDSIYIHHSSPSACIQPTWSSQDQAISSEFALPAYNQQPFPEHGQFISSGDNPLALDGYNPSNYYPQDEESAPPSYNQITLPDYGQPATFDLEQSTIFETSEQPTSMTPDQVGASNTDQFMFTTPDQMDVFNADQLTFATPDQSTFATPNQMDLSSPEQSSPSSGNSPERCHKCKAPFKQKKDLMRHLNATKSHANGPWYYCSCGAPSLRKDNHKRHMKNCGKLVLGSYCACNCGAKHTYDAHLKHIELCGRRPAGRPAGRSVRRSIQPSVRVSFSV
ncbi:uncharacterized protein F4822DRAFT_195591 [Hypoxylon trugodes]|uniref:uncharacterized protein n=1 Tax=Hypoxylon trugodes TaxID=326681 RepID=UPI0021920BC2|nr:uncharacterized protein F4822DRAFT_195591 [Hypoxylon trugodes]KAI1389283.1 hypothetical protein F4822DRAFT_195591 [Hypoxylon trugodes]